LGYKLGQTLYYIILPQMKKNILPAFTNELDCLVKSTAVVSSIGLLDLTRVGMNIVSRELKPIPIYLTVAFFYLCMSAIINLIMKKLERKISYATSE
jgi:ABC-type amino acid transport system permease subunit